MGYIFIILTTLPVTAPLVKSFITNDTVGVNSFIENSPKSYGLFIFMIIMWVMWNLWNSVFQHESCQPIGYKRTEENKFSRLNPFHGI